MYEVKQRILKDKLIWCVTDGEQVICEGSYVACSNWAREWNENPRRLTQQQIDGTGEHRKGFTFALTQLRTAVAGSLRKAW